jgi:hypothetical protein
VNPSSTTIYWNLTGDITFNNGTQSYSSNQNTTSTQLNFGSSFTTGILCVYTISSTGLISDTICITINAPTSINNNNITAYHVFYNHSSHQMQINLNHKPLYTSALFIVFNPHGRQILRKEIRLSEPTILNIQPLPSGAYLWKLILNQSAHSGKFMVME